MIDDEAVRRIENLHRLKTEGVITEADFEKAKNELLNGPTQRIPTRAPFTATSPSTPIGLPHNDDHIAWITLPLRRYAEFTGRSTRKEFWMFQLIFVAVVLAGGVLAIPLGAEVAAPLATLCLLALAVPLVAVEVRRFHDQDMSGWFALLNLIPYVGWAVVWFFMLMEGKRGDNRFGPDPRD